MERSDLAFAGARSAYERSHVISAIRGVVLAGVIVVVALALHRTTQMTWFVAATLAATLATFGWRGGAWRRGGLAGVLAGVPVFIAPAIYLMATHGHCPDCVTTPSLTCVLICFGTSSAVGALAGSAALRDDSPRRFGLGAISGALLTGLLGCSTMGFGGAAGVVAGLVAGGLTGWVVGSRTAHA